MNIYWTKVKLRAAANQPIYLVISHWVVGTLYLSLYILLLDLCRRVVSLATLLQMCISELKTWWGTFPMLSLSGCVVGDASPSSSTDRRPCP